MVKLAISNIAWSAEEDGAVYQLMQQYGFTGLEFAPTRWQQDRPYESAMQVKTIADNLNEQYRFTIPSMQSILYGRSERLFASNEEREALFRYLKTAIDFAAVIGCKNLVFGSPKNRYLPDASVAVVAVAFFRNLAEYAWQQGTVVSMEANPEIYGTNYITTTAEAAALVREVNHPGFRINLDVGTMIQNGETVESIEEWLPLVQHIHISEPYLALIEKRELHKTLVRMLLQTQYDKYLSIEMKRPDKAVVQHVENVLCYIHNLTKEGR